MNGKGDSPRKKAVSEETWSKNLQRIFGKNNERNKSKNKNNRSK